MCSAGPSLHSGRCATNTGCLAIAGDTTCACCRGRVGGGGGGGAGVGGGGGGGADDNSGSGVIVGEGCASLVVSVLKARVVICVFHLILDFIPFLFGCGHESWICLLLTFLAYIPGIIYAVYTITK